jgi:ionotropic glutamate receptor
MLGAVSPDSFDTLHSYSNTFQMPFVTPWFPEKVLAPSSGFLDYAISMRPEYHQAIIDTVKYYGWPKIIYLYDSNDGKLLHASRIFLDFFYIVAKLFLFKTIIFSKFQIKLF